MSFIGRRPVRAGDRVRVTGPGAFHGEAGEVLRVRDDGGLLWRSEVHPHAGDVWIDPRLVALLPATEAAP